MRNAIRSVGGRIWNVFTCCSIPAVCNDHLLRLFFFSSLFLLTVYVFVVNSTYYTMQEINYCTKSECLKHVAVAPSLIQIRSSF